MNRIITVQECTLLLRINSATEVKFKKKCRVTNKINYAVIFIAFLMISHFVTAQEMNAKLWADSVFKTLSKDEQIAQLMVVRLSTIDGKTKQVTFFDSLVSTLVKQYNVGGICLFQGSPVKQASILNALQAITKTPILMSIDAEWGVGMRMTDSVLPLPKQMMLGAMNDATIMYRYGQIVAEQCKRVGIQVNYAPVVDVNNNPDNPVINDRSFGEDKYKVARFGIQYMKGMQDLGVMACAKHFPGHGDVAVDSHYDLPVINKTMAQLDSLELYPFDQIFKAGISSVMVAHLYIPSIDSTPNRATSLSPKNINGLLRNEMGYQGLTFTDALEMQGVKKYFPDGEASVQSIIAGNDMLCLPGDVAQSIAKIKEAIIAKKISWADIEMHCKKVLMAKYQYGLAELQPVNTNNLTVDLNSKIPAMTRLVAENAITLLAKKDNSFFPLAIEKNNRAGTTAYIAVGSNEENAITRRMVTDYNARIFYFDYGQKDSDATALINQIKNYQKIVIGIHNLNRAPANNFGISPAAVSLVNQLQQKNNAFTFLFGNAYAAKNWCQANNLVVCYEDDSIIQNTAIDLLQGKLPYQGTLPVTVCDNFKYGFGLNNPASFNFFNNNATGFDAVKMNRIDSIANDAIEKNAIPGCVVLVAKDGKIAYRKAFGNYSNEDKKPVTLESVYDMASVTKICATTLAVMKLYDEGKLDLKKKLGDYLPSAKGSNKENLLIEKILLHQAGLVAYIPFYKETLDASGVPFKTLYASLPTDSFSIHVAHNFYLRKDWRDTIYKEILQSPLGPADKYIYSDNDFIFLGKMVEAITGSTLDEYVRKTFYAPMSLSSIGFKPLLRMDTSRIVPTENEKQFRLQLLRGDVHDPGAAMFGGVAGHAGLFSDAYDLAAIMQMLLNGGTYNGKQYLQKETIDLFTAYHSSISRRGYGFDKPEKDNATRAEPYPALSASPLTFGHTGFTGTCVWADPASNLIFIFLSNRVNEPVQDLFLKMNVRPKINEVIYNAIIKPSLYN
ncbi:MAG: glycoside hydrolase family 3 N-terminal domain-containing protein [Ferruginibacter sp.]